jgi:hypothetical protein
VGYSTLMYRIDWIILTMLMIEIALGFPVVVRLDKRIPTLDIFPKTLIASMTLSIESRSSVSDDNRRNCWGDGGDEKVLSGAVYSSALRH